MQSRHSVLLPKKTAKQQRFGGDLGRYPSEVLARHEWRSRQHSVHATPEVARRLYAQNAFRIEMRDLFPIEIADRQLV
jgi:hypothetical protein